MKLPQLPLTVGDAFILPPGFGFVRTSREDLATRLSLFNTLLIWEKPRVRGSRQYVLGIDVGDGLGKDRSVIDVIRVGTLTEPEEEVAQFVSDTISPSALAYYADAIGHLYCDQDGYEAMAAIETNNHGLSTQDTLQLHLGYGHFYRWEYYDQADPSKRWSQKIGWVTTPRTRPILLDKFYAAVTAVHPVTKQADLILNSPYTIEELRDFQTETGLWEACAAVGAFDDCIMASAIGHYAAWRLAGGEHEPLSDRRARHLMAEAERARFGVGLGVKRDYRNTPVTTEEMPHGELAGHTDARGQAEDEWEEAILDVRGWIYG